MTLPIDQTGLRVRTWDVMRRAVEEGIACGWRRAHKHDESPSPAAIWQAIEDAVMCAIGEVFDFGEGL